MTLNTSVSIIQETPYSDFLILPMFILLKPYIKYRSLILKIKNILLYIVHLILLLKYI